MHYLVGIIITFFLAIVLISKKDKSRADKILAIWLFAIGLHLQLFYLHFSGQYIYFPHLLGLEIPMPLLHGPFLFLYIIAMTNPESKSGTLSHFIPTLLVYALCISFFRLAPDKKIIVYQHNGEGFEWLSFPVFISVLLSGTIYIALSWHTLRIYKRNFKSHSSITQQLDLQWIMYLIYGIGIIWLVVALGNDIFTFTAVTSFVILLGYLGIKKGNVFSHYQLSYTAIETARVYEQAINTQHDRAEISISEQESEKVKYLKSTLKEEDANSIYASLKQLMQTEELFKNPELNLGDLAARLSIHPNTLSQVINSFEQKHFYDYINDLRIEAFKKTIQLPDSRKYTMLALAYECGFNSKTTFNRTFKKATGASPKEYLAQPNRTD